MMRQMGITLLLCTTALAAANRPAWADDPSVGASGRALVQTPASSGKAERVLSWGTRDVGLQIGVAAALAEPALRAVIHVAQPARESRAVLSERAGLPVGQGAIPPHQNALSLVDLGGSKPVLAYPVSASFTLGLGYRYVKGEDLVFKTVDPGSLSPDYDSHNVLLRARWRF